MRAKLSCSVGNGKLMNTQRLRFIISARESGARQAGSGYRSGYGYGYGQLSSRRRLISVPSGPHAY